jgi:hypothetical protein
MEGSKLEHPMTLQDNLGGGYCWMGRSEEFNAAAKIVAR